MKNDLPAWAVWAAIIGAVTAVLLTAALLNSGTRYFSVDEGDYVAHNEAVYRTIPPFPHVTRFNSYSIGRTAPNAFNTWSESGPPYGSFETYHLYVAPARYTCDEVLRYYDHLLVSQRWTGGTTNRYARTYSSPRGASLSMYCDKDPHLGGATAWSMSLTYD